MQGKLSVMKLHAVWGSWNTLMAEAGGMPSGDQLSSHQTQVAAAAVESV